MNLCFLRHTATTKPYHAPLYCMQEGTCRLELQGSFGRSSSSSPTRSPARRSSFHGTKSTAAGVGGAGGAGIGTLGPGSSISSPCSTTSILQTQQQQPQVQEGSRRPVSAGALGQGIQGTSFLATEGPLAGLRVIDGRVHGTLGEEEEELKRRQAAVPRRVSYMSVCKGLQRYRKSTDNNLPK